MFIMSFAGCKSQQMMRSFYFAEERRSMRSKCFCNTNIYVGTLVLNRRMVGAALLLSCVRMVCWCKNSIRSLFTLAAFSQQIYAQPRGRVWWLGYY